MTNFRFRSKKEFQRKSEFSVVLSELCTTVRVYPYSKHLRPVSIILQEEEIGWKGVSKSWILLLTSHCHVPHKLQFRKSMRHRHIPFFKVCRCNLNEVKTENVHVFVNHVSGCFFTAIFSHTFKQRQKNGRVRYAVVSVLILMESVVDIGVSNHPSKEIVSEGKSCSIMKKIQS